MLALKIQRYFSTEILNNAISYVLNCGGGTLAGEEKLKYR